MNVIEIVEKISMMGRDIELLKESYKYIPTATQYDEQPRGGKDGGKGWYGTAGIPGAPGPIDKKLVCKPQKYKGDITIYVDWQSELKNFLKVQDERWEGLLERIEKCGAKPIVYGDTATDPKVISSESGILVHHEAFLGQLYTYLNTFTEGTANRALCTAGEKDVYETYRRMNEKGRSRRPQHVLRLHSQVIQPTPAAKLPDLESAINVWEANLAYFEKINEEGTVISSEQRRLILINLCPRELKDHLLDDCSKFDTYEKVKVEILDKIHMKMAPESLSGALHSFQEECKEPDEYSDEAEFEVLGDGPTAGYVAALVKNGTLKIKKGFGKGKSTARGAGDAVDRQRGFRRLARDDN